MKLLTIILFLFFLNIPGKWAKKMEKARTTLKNEAKKCINIHNLILIENNEYWDDMEYMRQKICNVMDTLPLLKKVIKTAKRNQHPEIEIYVYQRTHEMKTFQDSLHRLLYKACTEPEPIKLGNSVE